MNRYIVRKINGRWIVARGCRIIDSSRSWETAMALACWYARCDVPIPYAAPAAARFIRSAP